MPNSLCCFAVMCASSAGGLLAECAHDSSSIPEAFYSVPEAVLALASLAKAPFTSHPARCLTAGSTSESRPRALDMCREAIAPPAFGPNCY